MVHRSLFVLVLAALLLMPVGAQDAALANPTACVAEYDAEADYFPAKAEVTFASGFSVEYFANYKVVTVTRPFPGAGADDAFQYVLVQCGTPAPEGFDGAQVLTVPMDSAIAMSTTYLPHFTTLGLLDALMGVDGGLYVSTPEVVEKYAAGDLLEVGYGAEVNVEVVLDSEADVVFAYASGSPEYDAHPKLVEAGVPVAINADYAEITPLGRAEWIKFTALFFNAEAEANTYFDGVAERYAQLQALTADLPEDEKPLVLWNSFSSFIDAWSIPGQQTFVGAFLTDAGARWVLSDQAPESSVNQSFESVFEAGAEADVWVPGLFGIATLADVLAADARYADFAAFQSGQVFNTDGRANPNGGNDYYENGVNEPDVVLADLVAIFHPELLPEHTPVYLRQVPAE
ncbi:MAG: ABC transporter substrate-binding protein [Anaerolineae bacterium]|nr:ABC transporter substrate-binding protein [Anaerolineae bacterium]